MSKVQSRGYHSRNPSNKEVLVLDTLIKGGDLEGYSSECINRLYVKRNII